MANIDFYNGGRLLTSGWEETPRPIIDRTEMEDGPAKQRPRQSSTTIERPITMLYTADEYAGFKSWFKNTCRYGSLYFNWTLDPDKVTKDGRIVNGEYTARAVNAKLSHYNVTFKLETAY